VKQSDGSLSVSIGTGQPLVVGNTAYGLQTVQSQSVQNTLEVAWGATSGSLNRLPQSSIQGGVLGGVLAFRSQTLSQTQNMLGLVATGVAGTFNQQHALGQDLNGAMANSTNSFFTDPVTVVNANTANTGTATVSAAITNYSKLTGSDYSLAYDGTKYTLTRLSDNKVTTAAGVAVAGVGPAITINLSNSDGISISIPTGAKAGDKFLIQPTINGANNIAVVVSDTAKIAVAAPVMTNASLANTGTATISSGALDLAGTNAMPGIAAVAAAVPPTISFSATPATFSVDGTAVTLNTDVTAPGTGSGVGTFQAAIQAGLTAAGLTSYSVSAAAGGGLQIVHSGSLSAVVIIPTNATAVANGIGTTLNTPSAGLAGPMYTAATLTPPVTLTYNSITKTLSGFPAGMPVTVTTNGTPAVTTSYPAPAGAVPFTNGATIDFGGINFSITGAPVNGDTFTVTQNPGSTTDNRNALLLAGLQANNTMQGGTANYEAVYSQLVSKVGVQTNSLKINSTAQTNSLNQSIAAQQSLSGVNLDEEAANLLRYQQAYQAAGKALQVASTLFDTLLSLGK
jgi:flagellar hook-associated protein 1 FlgK